MRWCEPPLKNSQVWQGWCNNMQPVPTSQAVFTSTMKPWTEQTDKKMKVNKWKINLFENVYFVKKNVKFKLFLQN